LGANLTKFSSEVRVNIFDNKAGGTTKYCKIINLTDDGFQLLLDMDKVQIPVTDITIGKVYRIVEVGDTDYTLIGAANNNVGTKFTATGVGSGTGIVQGSSLVFKESDLDPGTTPIDIPRNIYISIDIPLHKSFGSVNPGVAMY